MYFVLSIGISLPNVYFDICVGQSITATGPKIQAKEILNIHLIIR